MKKAIFASLLALMFCVFCVSACQKEENLPPAELSSDLVSTPQPTPERTRAPVSHSTLPPLPETTEIPETTRELDDSLFLPETFEEQEGTLAVGSDEPGYGEVGQ